MCCLHQAKYQKGDGNAGAAGTGHSGGVMGGVPVVLAVMVRVPKPAGFWAIVDVNADRPFAV